MTQLRRVSRQDCGLFVDLARYGWILTLVDQLA